MRRTRLFLSLLFALTAAACARQQAATYYVMDPNTGQPVPVVQRYNAPQQQYAAGAYAQSQPQSYAQPQPQPQPQAKTGERGLFNNNVGLFSHRSTTYAPQPQYAQPQYAQPQPQYAAPPAQPQRGLVQQQYGQQGYTMQYQPPQPQVGGPYAAAPAAPQPAPQYGYAYAPAQPAYTLDSGDKLRVVVFGQDGITGSYMVDAGGNVSLPLVGTIPARGLSTQALAKMIAERLKQGYVREPHVTVEIEAYRPFFILGEVTTPGQYPYVANMTVENAVAIAGGFAARADKRKVEITRNANGQRYTGNVPLNYPLQPGDTVVVKERWF